MIKQTNAYEFSVDKSDSFNPFSSNSTGLHKKMRHSQEQNVRKGAWTSEEDMLLKKYIEKHGEGKWRQVPLRAGLRRCRKSCRLRWLNYLRPNIKRGNFEEDEIDLILRLHKLLGNRWSLIAGRVPGRTANDIKNFWNTHLRKKLRTDKKYFMKNDRSVDSNRATTVIRPKTVVPSANSEWLRKLRATTNTKSPSTQEISPQSLFVPAIENEDEWWHCLLNEKTMEESSNDITTDSMNFSTEIDELCRSIDGFGEKKDGEDRIVYFDECGDLLLNNEFFAP